MLHLLSTIIMVLNLLIRGVTRRKLDWHSDSIKSNQNEATMASAAAFTSDQKTYWLDWVVPRVRYRARPTRSEARWRVWLGYASSPPVLSSFLLFVLSPAPGVIWNATSLLSLCFNCPFLPFITIAPLWNAVVSKQASLAFVEFFKELFCHSSVRPFK